ncbi:MAG: ribokinase [Thermoleophilia bacterium]|nr:ribokinase [Thermoleophilia bacterium]
MRVAVVGHVEWVEFARVERLPAPGEIVAALRHWQEAGGGGAVAALQLAALAGNATLYTALGDDEYGRRAARRLEERGLRVVAAWRDEPQRRAFTFLDADAERTITLLGPKVTPRGDDDLPWSELDEMDAVYFTARDAGALTQARRARVLVSTARELPTLIAGGVRLDALVHSGADSGERVHGETLEPAPELLVTTAGSAGGTYALAGGGLATYAAVRPPGPVFDSYGAGDCFAAGLTYALGRGDAVQAALDLASRCGAAALTGPGVHVRSP